MDPKALDIATFKDHFDGGQFSYGTAPPDARDKDIALAILEMQAVLNAGLYPDENSLLLAKLYLTAHFLHSDLKAARKKGEPSLSPASWSVDGVSESLHISDWMKEGDNILYITSAFGVKWLMLTGPTQQVGYAACILGRTHP